MKLTKLRVNVDDQNLVGLKDVNISFLFNSFLQKLDNNIKKELTITEKENYGNIFKLTK